MVFILKEMIYKPDPVEPERTATVSGSNQDRASGSLSHLDEDAGAHAIAQAFNLESSTVALSVFTFKSFRWLY